MKVKFCGAAREVTGSSHLITLDNGFKILLDCGLYQGGGDDDGQAPDLAAADGVSARTVPLPDSSGFFLDFDDPARVCALLLEHHALFLLLCLVRILARLLLL
jgi:hypothetical protein